MLTPQSAADLIGSSVSSPTTVAWDSDDSVLYELAIGGGQKNPGLDLEFTTNNTARRQRVHSTFGANLTAGVSIPWLLDVLSGTVDTSRLLHGDQSHQQLVELAPSGSAIVTARISAIWDKQSATVVECVAEMVDTQTAELLARSSQSMFFRGTGGWGGERGPRGGTRPIPDTPCDRRLSIATRPDQPLLYRLTGDPNPIHTDPETARAVGFEGPIMHGMCVFGIVGKGLLTDLADSDPGRFLQQSARFVRPVVPGDELTVEVWQPTPGEAQFTVLNPTGDVVLSDGTFDYVPR